MLGATPQANGTTTFRVWAPEHRQVEVCLEENPRAVRYLPLQAAAGGYFEGTHPARAGTRYRYRLGGKDCFPDPASRFQPEGPHGPSEIIDASTWRWSDADWRGLTLAGSVFYELHVGAFTPEGTYSAAAKKLDALKDLGITCIELMPLSAWPGAFNWGYDGVNLFAPYAGYGRPDELRAFVDAAHARGLGVILDVVYNHFGPDGNYLRQFSKSYFSTKYAGEWGDPLNYDSDGCEGMRAMVVENAARWIAEYHFDGLRLDATQGMFDQSSRHVLAEISRAAREAAGKKPILLIGENEPQDAKLVTDYGLDALWIDDFHHAARVALTGHSEAYYSDYCGNARELVSCVLRNGLYQGQRSRWQNKQRGSALRELEPKRAVFFVQNHDQVANSLTGERLHRLANPADARAITALVLLAPQTPLLFMGQEWNASSPFHYFIDHNAELDAAVRKGRSEFLAQFPSIKHALDAEGFRLTWGRDAFAASTLDWKERERPEHAHALAYHRELLALRKRDPLFAGQERSQLAGTALNEHALLLRWTGNDQLGDRLLIVNLGSDLSVDPCPEPLLVPISGSGWRPILSSEETRFGGRGATFPEYGKWSLPGHCALVLTCQGD